MCVPPKAGSTAYSTIFRGEYLERIISQVQAGSIRSAIASDILFSPVVRRVAIIRHPVERILSTWRAFCISNPNSRKGKLLMRLEQYVRDLLPQEMRLPCNEARRIVNQHFRTQRCFCGFEIPGVLERTKVLLMGDGGAANIRAIREILPESDLWARWTQNNYGKFRNMSAEQYLTPRFYSEHSSHTDNALHSGSEYSAELLRAIYDAVEPEFEFFRPYLDKYKGDFGS